MCVAKRGDPIREKSQDKESDELSSATSAQEPQSLLFVPVEPRVTPANQKALRTHVMQRYHRRKKEALNDQQTAEDKLKRQKTRQLRQLQPIPGYRNPVRIISDVDANSSQVSSGTAQVSNEDSPTRELTIRSNSSSGMTSPQTSISYWESNCETISLFHIEQHYILFSFWAC